MKAVGMLLLALLLTGAVLIRICLGIMAYLRRRRRLLRRRQGQQRLNDSSVLHGPDASSASIKSAKKPQWVLQEIIRLKAAYPRFGCRKIAALFNRIYRHRHNTSIGKSTVALMIQQHQYAIHHAQRQVRNKPRSVYLKNRLWALDLTLVKDNVKQPHLILGIVDCGTRAYVSLEQIADKTSSTLLKAIINAIDTYGAPRKILMDNEPSFKSTLFRALLWLKGVKVQYTQVASPWQNGRIERFFGTFKAEIKRTLVEASRLEQRLIEFRCWYNFLRPHSSLQIRTPAEVHNQRKPDPRTPVYHVALWDGALSGFYQPPD